jgi:hypothetical protein
MVKLFKKITLKYSLAMVLMRRQTSANTSSLVDIVILFSLDQLEGSLDFKTFPVFFQLKNVYNLDFNKNFVCFPSIKIFPFFLKTQLVNAKFPPTFKTWQSMKISSFKLMEPM